MALLNSANKTLNVIYFDLRGFLDEKMRFLWMQSNNQMWGIDIQTYRFSQHMHTHTSISMLGLILGVYLNMYLNKSL